jgi:PAS domain S-box-containing protein
MNERECSDDTLREIEERFRITFNQAAVGIAHISPDGHFLRVNRKYCDIVGYNYDELIKRTFWDITHPDDRENDRKILHQLLDGTIDTTAFEKRYIRKDGSIVWVNLTSSAVREKNRPLKYFIAVIEDITERKHTEETIRTSREMLRLVMDNVPQAVFWKDVNSVYLGCNAVFARFAGVETPDNIVGKTDYGLAWTKEEADSFRKDDRRVMDTNTPIYHIIEPQLQADGKHAWLDTNKIPLHDKEGKVVGILGTYEDITERKNYEIELERLKSQAELYVDIMAHDINNMNQAMMGYLEMALGLPDMEKEEKDLIEKPLEIVGHSSKLIDNVKKIRKLEAGEVRPETMDLGKVLSDVKAEYNDTGGRDITIQYTPVTGYDLKANELLPDIFSNLVGNAIKHTTGALAINIDLAKVSRNGTQYYRVSVEDNGPGVPDDLKKKLFSEITKNEHKALRRGIGLQLVKTLVRELKGDVWVEDRVKGDSGKGSRFVVLLPIKND